jgi:hypothetical protein
MRHKICFHREKEKLDFLFCINRTGTEQKQKNEDFKEDFHKNSPTIPSYIYYGKQLES